jgi:hypothetical protein
MSPVYVKLPQILRGVEHVQHDFDAFSHYSECMRSSLFESRDEQDWGDFGKPAGGKFHRDLHHSFHYSGTSVVCLQRCHVYGGFIQSQHLLCLSPDDGIGLRSDSYLLLADFCRAVFIFQMGRYRSDFGRSIPAGEIN